MKILQLKPADVTPAILARLERRGSIRTFKPGKKALNVKEGKCVVEKIYSTAPRFGAHKLICVGKNETRIALTTHPDNEDFIVMNPTGHKFKPLYLIIGLDSRKNLERKARDGRLSARDMIALRLKYNDPKVSLFTMLKDTPHCEVTVPGKGAGPVFFVTEPADFRMAHVKLHNYENSIYIL